jgi:hypothetical protein
LRQSVAKFNPFTVIELLNLRTTNGGGINRATRICKCREVTPGTLMAVACADGIATVAERKVRREKLTHDEPRNGKPEMVCPPGQDSLGEVHSRAAFREGLSNFTSHL